MSQPHDDYTILEPPLIERLRAAADEVEEFPHPSHCEHLHNASRVMREAALAIEAASAQLTREAERWYRALIAERNAFAQQAGECSGAVQTMHREISALTADLAVAREDLQTLAGAFWRLDYRGWIDTYYYDGDEEECYHIRDIGRLIVDKVRTAIDAARKGSDTVWTPESHLGAVSDPQPYPPVKPARKGSANG